MSNNENIIYQEHQLSKKDRSLIKSQNPCILWFTGLSGSGKSTISNAVEVELNKLNKHTYLLDGDNIRLGLNKDLNFSDQDRIENIRRIGEISKLFVDSGMIVLTAFISPFINEREIARNLVNKNEFIEIFVDTPLEICEERDPKGLYKKARNGEIVNFTGIDSPYEKPINPELRIINNTANVNENVSKIITYLIENKYI